MKKDKLLQIRMDDALSEQIEYLRYVFGETTVSEAVRQAVMYSYAMLYHSDNEKPVVVGDVIQPYQVGEHPAIVTRVYEEDGVQMVETISRINVSTTYPLSKVTPTGRHYNAEEIKRRMKR